MMKQIGAVAIAAVALAAAEGASAATTIYWADLTTQAAGQVAGTIALPSGNVGVTYNGPYAFAQSAPGQAYYWSGNAYTFDGENHAPPTSDLIALDTGGLKTITFSQTVSDVYLALISWNGNSGTFTQPFEVVSSGSGNYGTGTFQTVGPAPHTTFVGTGEPHGIIRFTGSFDSVSFADNNEYWHGMQIGIGSLAPPPPTGAVPEPATWAMMLLGFGFVGGAMRSVRRRQKLNVSYA